MRLTDVQPERIQGLPYGVKSDVWSLGVSLIELALGRFPMFGDGETMGILELLQHIVSEPAPKLTTGKYPPQVEAFLKNCLWKDPNARKTPKELLVSGLHV